MLSSSAAPRRVSIPAGPDVESRRQSSVVSVGSVEVSSVGEICVTGGDGTVDVGSPPVSLSELPGLGLPKLELSDPELSELELSGLERSELGPSERAPSEPERSEPVLSRRSDDSVPFDPASRLDCVSASSTDGVDESRADHRESACGCVADA